MTTARPLPEPDPTFHDPRPPTTTHLGRAGEQFVASHLLRLGYNASPLPIDTGVDLLAHWTTKDGDSRVAQFQVKTTERKRISFSLTKPQLERWWREQVNLAVVFWYDPAAPFALVIPPSLSYMLTSGGDADPRRPVRVSDKGATITVASPGPRRAYVGNRHQDLSAMVDRYDRIEATDEDSYHVRAWATWAFDDKRMIDIDP